MRLNRFAFAVTAAALLFAGSAYAENKIDPGSGLIIAPGFEVTKTNCTACHGAGFIITSGYSRDVWLEQIRWMQKDQGLWEFTPEVEKEILDYLETYYPPKQ
ncbi:MAG: cytochrome C [Campylobacterales bacterium]